LFFSFGMRDGIHGDLLLLIITPRIHIGFPFLINRLLYE
jgi:hypothetical protein